MSHDLESERSAASLAALRADVAHVRSQANGRVAHCGWHLLWLPGAPLEKWPAVQARLAAAEVPKPAPSAEDKRDLAAMRRIRQIKAESDRLGTWWGGHRG